MSTTTIAKINPNAAAIAASTVRIVRAKGRRNPRKTDCYNSGAHRQMAIATR